MIISCGTVLTFSYIVGESIGMPLKKVADLFFYDQRLMWYYKSLCYKPMWNMYI